MPLSPTTAARFDRIVTERQSAGRAPALIAAVIRDGAVDHVHAAGTPAPGTGTQSRIGSISKTFTAALVLGLHDEGRLDLDRPVAAHLPGLALATPTPRQLLSHVSGLRREPSGPWWERNPGGDIDAMIAAVDPGAAIHPPRHTHHYSNLGYGLLGAVVTAVTGQPWAKVLTDRLLVPLGMTRTTYDPAEPYLRGVVPHPHMDIVREEPCEDSGAMAPAGQLWSTVDDLARWAAFLIDPDPDVLDPATVARMHTPAVLGDPESWNYGYGLGLQMWRAGERVYAGHTGSMPGYLAVLMVHRRSRTGVVAFANSYTLGGTSISALGKDLLTAVLDGEPEPVPVFVPADPPPPAVAALLGTWWWMGSRYEMTWRDGLALTDAAYGEAWRLERITDDEWLCHGGMNDGETMLVRRDTAGTPLDLDIATFVFTRDPWPDIVR